MNIKKAAELFDLSADTLRYYERIGVIPTVHRNSSGYRDYTTKDLNWVYLAKSLRRAGLSVESLIDFAYLAQFREKQNVEDAQKQILSDQLEEINQKIEEMQEVKELLLYKIESYDAHLSQFNADKMTADTVEKFWILRKTKI